ncbi:HU family DNA-binding protein [Francisellaceae bacterium]|nr:HU family DNA-binding protein [Francisellaceae bacterium]
MLDTIYRKEFAYHLSKRNPELFPNPVVADKSILALIELVSIFLLNGSTVNFTGFGSFSLTPIKSRYRFLPPNNQKYLVPSKNKVTFKIGDTFNKKINPDTPQSKTIDFKEQECV